MIPDLPLFFAGSKPHHPAWLWICGLSAAIVAGHAAEHLRWESIAEGRFSSLTVPPGKTGFTQLLPGQTGIAFTNQLSDQSAANNRVLENGSGVALGDVDGDGLCDIYFCRLEGDNALYRNLGGWRFEDITARAGVACAGQPSTGATMADVDGDGDLDLLVNGIGAGTRAFQNDGRGVFTEMTGNRLVRKFGATSMALADMDGDGDLDLYVTNYRTDTFKDNPPGLRVEARKLPDGGVAVDPPDRFVALQARTEGVEIVEKGERDFLYLNQGGGRFAPVAWDKGTFLDEDGNRLAGPTTDWGLSVIFRDINGDGWPDLYVCNDFVYWPDRLWLNVEGRGFRAAPRSMLRNQSLASMAVDVADINRDGWDDFFVADMLSRQGEWRTWQRPNTMAHLIRWPLTNPDFRPEVTRNTLQLARGDGTFAEMASYAGVAATEWTWGAVFLDVDLDGWEDLLISNGNNHDVQDADVLAALKTVRERPSPESRLRHLSRFPRLACQSLAYRNLRQLRFVENGASWGFAQKGIAHGMALADLDNDGDLDVAINCLHEPARILRNDSPAHRIAVRLRGARENSFGVGARIKVSGGPVEQSQVMIAGGRYASGDDYLRTFAAGDATELQITVEWPGGARTTVRNARPDCLYEIHESKSTKGSVTEIPAPKPLFREASGQLTEKPFGQENSTLDSQPLLRTHRSRTGFGVTWADADGDGDDDLIVPGGKGGRMLEFVNHNGAISVRETSPGTNALPAAQTLVLPWRQREGSREWLVAGDRGLEIVHNRSTKVVAPIPNANVVSAAIGTTAAGSWLFLGTDSPTGVWPTGARGHLLRLKGSEWKQIQTLDLPGPPSSAVFTDLDGDGFAELAIAPEWGTIGIWKADGENWKPALAGWQLARAAGGWQSISAGDFDGDGRMDLAAGNWGENWLGCPAATGSTDPWELALVEVEKSLATIWMSMDPFAKRALPSREWSALTTILPGLLSEIPTHHSLGASDFRAVLAKYSPQTRFSEGREFRSGIWLNRGESAEFKPFPPAAQFTPVFGLAIADADGDGREDVFLTQNQFGVDPESSRHDAGLGLWLLGDGNGSFCASPPAESGIVMLGEGRGAAVADVNQDGRIDLAATEWNGPVHLWLNDRGVPGVVVEFHGETASISGSSVRLEWAGSTGPRREFHAGAGWRSCDSSKLVLGSPDLPVAARILRPGHAEQRISWPAGSRRLKVP